MAADREDQERELSRGVVAIYKEYTGRGPSRAVSTITDTLATVVLGGGMTKGEATLAAEGRGGLVSEMRRDFHDVMENDIRSLVESTTGRTVFSLMSDHDIDRDVAVEVLLFDSSEPSQDV